MSDYIGITAGDYCVGVVAISILFIDIHYWKLCQRCYNIPECQCLIDILG
jgi:hypothetical protein